MTDPITTPAQMREAAARLIENLQTFLSHYADKDAWDGYPAMLRTMIADAETLRRALPVAEPAPVAVRVKPLVAGRHPRGFIATDHGGGAAYIFALNGGRYECIKGLAHSPRFDTSKEALAAAEADHAARVLSQIDAVPAAQVRAEALREAAALPPYDGDGDPAGSFDHHVFVKRDAIRALIEKEPT